MPFYLFLRERGRLDRHLRGAGNAVGLLISHGNDGGGVNHGQVGREASVQAAANILQREARVSMDETEPSTQEQPSKSELAEAETGGRSKERTQQQSKFSFKLSPLAL